MTKTYFTFAIADSMLKKHTDSVMRRQEKTLDEIAAIVKEGVVSGLNHSHKPTIQAMKHRFGLDVEIPKEAPKIYLNKGDKVIVMAVQGLDRLQGRSEYTEEEIQGAEFTFSLWTLLE